MFNKSSKATILFLLPIAMAAVIPATHAEVTTNNAVDLSATKDLFSQPIKPNPLTSDPSTVLIRVNGEEITRGDIAKALQQSMARFGGQVPPEQLQQIQAQLLPRIKDSLITEKLLSAAVVTEKVEVSAEDLSNALARISESLPEGETLESALQKENLSLDKMKEDLTKQLAIQKLLESKVESISEATEEDAKAFYDSNPEKFEKPEAVTASHILIKFDESDTDETKAAKKAKLEKIRADIIAGSNTFENAAGEFSDCPSKAQGGSLGSFEKGKMVPEFEVAAFSQEVGEVGDVIETKFGYHIIKVSEHQDAGVISFDEAKDRIIEFLSGQKKQEAVKNYLKELRDEATIEDLTLQPTEQPAAE